MRILYKLLRLQKAGNLWNECEDWAYPPNKDIAEYSFNTMLSSEMRFAVADGATESLLCSQWAQLLVKAFCRSKKSDFDECIRKARWSWERWLENYLKRREKLNPIKWYEEPGLERGAFATLLGISIHPPIKGCSGKWSAFAVGDSCVFQIRKDHILKWFPLISLRDFNNRPQLINTKDQAKYEKSALFGDYTEGDILFLATDALAQWFLKQYEENNYPWDDLLKFKGKGNHAQFSAWLENLRTEKLIKNDDVVLALIELAV